MDEIGVDQKKYGGRHRLWQREIHLDGAENEAEKVDGGGGGGGRLT